MTLTTGTSVPARRLEADRSSSESVGSPGFTLLNAYFDKVYLVTIERNADRRKIVDADLRGLEFSYFYGADGRLLPEAEIARAYSEKLAMESYGKPLSLGQIGCALSHRLVYEDVLRCGYERVLVLEDDARACHESLWAVGPVLSQLPADWDLLYMCTKRPGETPWHMFKLAWLYPLLNTLRIRDYPVAELRKRHSRGYSRNLRVAGKHFLTAAYAINRRAAERMLDMQTPVRVPSDWALRSFCAMPDMKAFLSVPNLFDQRGDVDSSIWNRPARKARLQNSGRGSGGTPHPAASSEPGRGAHPDGVNG